MERRYTRQDLIAEAQAAGYTISGRLITDWVQLGLLDQPERHGLGRENGSIAYWPERQHHLLITLLAKRQEGAHVGPLCNIPVWLWLWFGDEYAPLRQVRRALQTWGEFQGIPRKGASWTRARHAASEFIGQVGHPKAKVKDRKALQEGLAQMLSQGRFDGDRLLPLVRRVFDPRGTGVPRGPIGGQLSPEDLVNLFKGRYLVLQHVETPSDSLFEWARFFYLSSLQSYLKDRPYLATDLDFGKLFTEPELSDIINNACLSVVSTLGLALVMLSDWPIGALENPQTWIANHLQGRITRTAFEGQGQVHVSGVILTPKGNATNP